MAHGPKKGRAHLHLPAALLRKLAAESARTGISQSKIAEQGILLRLAELAPPA